MAAASRAALSALPMATVATGMPRGIWTIESSESRPPRCLVGMGTPMTGRGVLAASIPGRCAAPPAPAMSTRSPRSAAVSAYRNRWSGRAVRGHDPQLGRDRPAGPAPAAPAPGWGSPSGCHPRCPRRAARAGPAVGSLGSMHPDDARASSASRSSAACARSSAGPRRVAVRGRGQVAHLATLEHLTLAVQVEVRRRASSKRVRDPRRAAPAVGPVAQEVDHRRGRERLPAPERQSADGPDVLLELGRRRSLRCVAWPLLWTRGASSLTTSDPSGEQEQLHGQDAHQVHRLGQRRGDRSLAATRPRRAHRRASATRPGCRRRGRSGATGKGA